MAAESVELGTVYLVDLVGSTRLASALGPAATEAVRQEFFALQRQAIATTGGDEFKNTGDGLMVAFTSASAAVACAVLTQQLFERRNRTAEVPLHLRIGLATGESTRRDGDYFGMPATEASRLCDKAPTDGILLSALTKALAGRTEGIRFEPFGALELKGLPEPVETFTVAWEPLDPERAAEGSARWPLPEALRVAPRVAYVGRVAEREQIDAAIARAREGARQITMLAGAPGIGKTRLAAHAALNAAVDGFAVCWGACSEELTAPYEPWIAICTRLVDHLDEAVLDGYIARAGGEVGRIAATLGRRRPDAPAPQPSDPETERLLLFNAVAELLRATADTLPLCVVLDDFQWADGQSLALLRHVARTVEQSALQILVTYRDSDVGRGHPLEAALADLRRVEGVQRLTLDGLGAEDVGELMRAVAGHDLDADGLTLSAELAAETGGNPFFLGELLRSFNEAGTIVRDDETGRWRVDREALRHPPASVREVIERRVDRLGDEARAILTAAAVIGPVFDLAVLVTLVDADEDRVLNVLDEAVRASLVQESADTLGRFSFEHALINRTLYDGLGATRRAGVHLRVAQSLEAQLGEDPGARIGELATHWDMAGGPDPAKAIEYARRAGDHALRELAPDEARRRFERGLELLGDRDLPLLRCDLLTGLGEAMRRGGDPAHRELLLEASQLACALRDGPRAAAAALANSRGQTSAMGHLDLDRVAAIEQALELDTDRARRARLLGILADELLYDTDVQRRLDATEEALAIARSIDDPQTHCLVLNNWFRVRQTLEELPERARHIDELLGAIQRCGDSPAAFFAAMVARNALVESARLDGVPAISQRMDEIAARLGDPLLTWVNTYCHACWELFEGRLDEAERYATRALTLGTQLGQSDAQTIVGVQLMVTRIVQGRGEELLGNVEQMIAANPRLVGFQAVKARILCGLGRAGEAREILDQGRRVDFDHVGWEQSRAVTYALFAEAAAEAGDTAAAERLYDRLLPLADAVIWNNAVCYGHQRIYLGLLAAALGRHAEADEHFGRAVEVQAEAGMLVWEASARVGWAASLAQRGEHAAATEQAARGLAIAREHGYGLFRERAEAILAAGPAAR